MDLTATTIPSGEAWGTQRLVAVLAATALATGEDFVISHAVVIGPATAAGAYIYINVGVDDTPSADAGAYSYINVGVAPVPRTAQLVFPKKNWPASSPASLRRVMPGMPEEWYQAVYETTSALAGIERRWYSHVERWAETVPFFADPSVGGPDMGYRNTAVPPRTPPEMVPALRELLEHYHQVKATLIPLFNQWAASGSSRRNPDHGVNLPNDRAIQTDWLHARRSRHTDEYSEALKLWRDEKHWGDRANLEALLSWIEVFYGDAGAYIYINVGVFDDPSEDAMAYIYINVVDLKAFLIPSTEAWGSHRIEGPLVATLIPTAEAWGTHVLTVALAATLIPSAEAWGSHAFGGNPLETEDNVVLTTENGDSLNEEGP